MTDEEWLRCNHWRPMLDHLGERITRRKGMLYLCAGLWTIWNLLYSDASRRSVEAAELSADGLLDSSARHDIVVAADCATFLPELDGNFLRDYPIVRESENWKRLIQMGVITVEDISHGATLGNDHMRTRLWHASHLALNCLEDNGEIGLHIFGRLNAITEWPGAWLVREIFGNPFRPYKMEAEWRTADVLGLARKAYEDRAYDLLPILSDAMEEAGCRNFELLLHLRGGGRHVRGCWALDAILGKA